MNHYVLIATHNRLSITRKNIECLLKCNVGVILVVSDSGEFALFKQLFPDISIVHHANFPLGLKWQAGVEVARELKADPLIVNGSDDILCPEYFTKVTELLKEGNHFVGLKSWYVYHMNKMYRFNYLANLPLGGGRAYSKKMLEVINYSVFDISRDRHLDDLSYGNVLNSKLKFAVLNDPLIMSVKGDWVMMNPTQKFFSSQTVKLVDTHRPEDILKIFNYVRD